MGAEEIVHDVAERVRAIVSEAEERAARIVRDAEGDAGRIRDRAETEAKQRLDEVRRALDELQGKIGVQGKIGAGAAQAEVEPGPVTVPEPEPPDVPEPGPEPVPEPTPEPAPQPEPPRIPEPEPPPDEGTPPQVAEAPGSPPKTDDAVAARLVAMNMALDGASREAIEAHLVEHYSVDDAGAIVNDVLALASK
jgi:outer membrane biosynthesis protein TonB